MSDGELVVISISAPLQGSCWRAQKLFRGSVDWVASYKEKDVRSVGGRTFRPIVHSILWPLYLLSEKYWWETRHGEEDGDRATPGWELEDV